MTNESKGKQRLLIAFVAALVMQAPVHAKGETASIWSFDDGTPTNAAATLVALPGTTGLLATATGIGLGKNPRFDATVPACRLWASIQGDPVNAQNEASLLFVNAGLPANTNSNDGGCVTIPDCAFLRSTNITVEAFVKVNRHVNWPLIVGKRRNDGNGTSWNLDMDNTGKPRIRIDSQPIGTTSGYGWNQCWTAPASIEDGQWHHLALTYSHTNRSVRLYVDHVLRVSGNSYSNLVFDTRELRIGQGAGDRAFDGWIDEIRITDAALTPEKFMATNEPSVTAGYWPFEDGATGTSAGTATNAFYAPFLHGYATGVYGGAKPVFSAATPPNTTPRVSDGTNGPVVNVINSGSLRFVNAGLPADNSSKAGGQITVSGYLLPVLTNFTAEAFVKTDRHVNFAQIVGKSRRGTGGLSWSMGVNDAGKLRARFDSQLPPATSGFNQTMESPAFVEDGMWHHVALTFESSTRKASLYLDYKKVHETVITNPIQLDDGDVTVGNGDRAFDGWIDELRITGQVLSPDKFLCTTPVVGSVTAVQ